MAGEEGTRGRRGNRFKRPAAALMHPVRQRIACLLADRGELDAIELAAVLGVKPAEVAYHLRVLVKSGLLGVEPKRPPTPPCYRWSGGIEWVRDVFRRGDER